MSKNITIVTAVVLVVIALAGGIWLYDFVLGETEAASATVSAPTLEVAASPTSAPMATSIPTIAPTQASPTDPCCTGSLGAC